MSNHATDPEDLTLLESTGDGDAALLREAERLVRNAVTDRPAVTLPEDVASDAGGHLHAHVSRPGDTVRVENLEGHLSRPARARGTYTVYDAPSFVTLIKRLSDLNRRSEDTPTDSETTLWAVQPSTGAAKPSVTAVFNDHDHDGLMFGWRDLRGTLEVRPDPDWQQWESRNAGAAGLRPYDRWLDQRSFAEFITDQMGAITGGLDLYQAVTKFNTTRSVRVQQVINLDDGTQQFQYVEDVNGSEKAGAVNLPTEVFVRLRPFYGAPVTEQRVILRHRVGKDGVTFGLYLHRPEITVETAWNAWCEQIAAELPGLPLFQGPAPASLKTAG